MDTAYLSRIESNSHGHTPSRDTIKKMAAAIGLSENESDELHALAGKIPADVEAILFADLRLLKTIRKKGEQRDV